MVSRISVSKKLGVGIAVLGLSLVMLSASSLHAISRLAASLDTAVNITARKLELIKSTQAAFGQLREESNREQIAYTILEMERHNADKSAGASCSACHTPAAPARQHRCPRVRRAQRSAQHRRIETIGLRRGVKAGDRPNRKRSELLGFPWASVPDIRCRESIRAGARGAARSDVSNPR